MMISFDDRLQTRHYKPVAVNREAILADREQMRQAVFAYICYAPGKNTTRNEVAAALGFDRHRTWNLLQELVRMRLLKVLAETRDRQMIYALNILEN